MDRKYNWLALAAGISTLLLILVSLFVPWWQLTVGDPAIANANLSPVNMNFGLLGTSLTIPLVWALNIATLLSLAAGAIVMLIYAIKPAKPYSKSLLGFAWNKPLFAVVLFAIEVVVLTVLPNAFVGFGFPLAGSANVQLPQSIAEGANISVGVSTGFMWPFLFAIIVAGLGVAARIYHRKLAVPPLGQIT